MVGDDGGRPDQSADDQRVHLPEHGACGCRGERADSEAQLRPQALQVERGGEDTVARVDPLHRGGGEERGGEGCKRVGDGYAVEVSPHNHRPDDQRHASERAGGQNQIRQTKALPSREHRQSVLDDLVEEECDPDQRKNLHLGQRPSPDEAT